MFIIKSVFIKDIYKKQDSQQTEFHCLNHEIIFKKIKIYAIKIVGITKLPYILKIYATRPE